MTTATHTAPQPAPATREFDSIESVIADIRAGRMVIVVDDEDRENEGDLVMAAEKVTPEAVNFMSKFGRGLICVPITADRANQLGLQSMVADNRESQRTDFTVSVDAARGVTTGISAADRAAAIQILADPESKATDLVQPGHIFPLRGKPGGVLRRAGHTEAAIDLAQLAGLRPAGILCEILHELTMARLPELLKFRTEHGLKLCTIRDLIAYRRTSEKLIVREQVIKLPTDYGDFDLHMYRSLLDDTHHLALVRGDITPDEPTMVRVHSECLTGDVFGSMRCDCGNQLHSALRQIDEAGRGVLVYMRRHEGRGIGLPAKIHAYKLQEEGLDTVEANEKLGFPAELRDYGIGAQILVDLGVRKMRFLSNNPKKIVGLEGYGLEIVELVPIVATPNAHNAKYLETKRTKMGHLI